MANEQAAVVAKSLKLENRMQKYETTECLFTFKDQKENFNVRPQCRTLNTAKNPLGKVSKIKMRFKKTQKN